MGSPFASILESLTRQRGVRASLVVEQQGRLLVIAEQVGEEGAWIVRGESVCRYGRRHHGLAITARLAGRAPLGCGRRAVVRHTRWWPGPLHVGQRRRHFGISAAALGGGALQVVPSVGRPSLLKAHVRHSFHRPEVIGREPQYHIPLVERALKLSPIDGDTRQQIMRVGVVRMALEPTCRDAQREIELPLTPQRLAKLQEDETRRVARELIAPTPNLVSHGRAPPRAPRARASAG